MEKLPEIFKSEDHLKMTLAENYQTQIQNYFGDSHKALEFLSNVMASVQRTPKLMECTPSSLINSFVVMASLRLMPSGISGEAYVLPYENRKKGICEAQFQLGYQGLVTLFYRAGVRSISAEIVYTEDEFSYVNGDLQHNPDVFSDKRGEPKGAYVIIELPAGGKVTKVMSARQILGIAQKFSKSYSGFGPWSKGQDPELWMWKKTVLKQASKLVPKNETIFKAIAEDNKDSVIADRLEGAKVESESLLMGNLLKDENQPKTEKDKNKAEDAKGGIKDK
jgi:phage RecT family recombinase